MSSQIELSSIPPILNSSCNKESGCSQTTSRTTLMTEKLKHSLTGESVFQGMSYAGRPLTISTNLQRSCFHCWPTVMHSEAKHSRNKQRSKQNYCGKIIVIWVSNAVLLPPRPLNLSWTSSSQEMASFLVRWLKPVRNNSVALCSQDLTY